MTYKCSCKSPDPANWSVIRISGRDYIVRCSACRQIWHTTAAYGESLPERKVTQYEWRHLIKTADYHKGEDPAEGEPDGYLDSNFVSRLIEEKK